MDNFAKHSKKRPGDPGLSYRKTVGMGVHETNSGKRAQTQGDAAKLAGLGSCGGIHHVTPDAGSKPTPTKSSRPPTREASVATQRSW